MIEPTIPEDRVRHLAHELVELIALRNTNTGPMANGLAALNAVDLVPVTVAVAELAAAACTRIADLEDTPVIAVLAAFEWRWKDTTES